MAWGGWGARTVAKLQDSWSPLQEATKRQRLASDEESMAILMKAEVTGQTREGYQQVFDTLAPVYASAPGFIGHFTHSTPDGWCVMDVWESRDHFQRFFGQHVIQRLPSTVRPKISFQELHDALTTRAALSAASSAA